jgi:hypothetical protein
VPLSHHLEQRGLHLGRGAVDLVGQHEVGHHRAEFDVELLAADAVDPGAEQVGRDQVGGELNAVEGAADHPREGLDSERLGHPGDAFDQQVPLRQQPDEHPLDQPVLPDDHPLDLEDRALQHRGVTGRRVRRRPGPGRADRRDPAGGPPTHDLCAHQVLLVVTFACMSCSRRHVRGGFASNTRRDRPRVVTVPTIVTAAGQASLPRRSPKARDGVHAASRDRQVGPVAR